VTVRTEPAGSGPGDGYALPGDAQLLLQLVDPATVNADGVTTSVDGVTVNKPRRRVTREELTARCVSFELQVDAPDRCPRMAARLVLEYFYPVGIASGRTVTSVDVELRGLLDTEVVRVLKRCQVRLDMPRPEGTAVLHVDGGDVLRLWGFLYQDRPFRLDGVARPEIDVARYLEEDISPEVIRNAMREFSGSAVLDDFRDWLQTVFDNRTNMIICDHCLSNVMWEMVEVDFDDYLGTRAAVVRWLPFRLFKYVSELSSRAPDPSGTVVACVVGPETQSQQCLDALSKLRPEIVPSLKEMKNRLRGAVGDVGLVFLYCHGSFSQVERTKLSLESDNYTESQLKTLELLSLKPRKGPRPVVFINACHSGRVRYDRNAYSGFPAHFLETVAFGVIGTLNYVDSVRAVEVTRKFLELLGSEADGLSPAEALQKIRTFYVEELLKNETEENWEAFLNAFLYVYYGSPHARLRLAARPEPGANP
jgi:hypothetical protein